MERLGVGSGAVLWPCLATRTCENTDRSVLGVAKAIRETRPNAFVFMRGVCMSAAFPRSDLFYFWRLPGATIGSLPAGWRDGQPTRPLLAASARWPRVGNGGGLPFDRGLKQGGKTDGTRVCCECSDAKLLLGAPDVFALRTTLWMRAS